MRYRDLYDDFHAKAAAEAGYDDFGPDDYQTGLRVLLDALDATPPPSIQRNAAEGHILDSLVSRLVTQANWKAHPEIFRAEIERPVIVIGLPRTGTTALHQLLALDPQFQGVERWIAPSPMIRPPRSAWETLSAYQSAVSRNADMRERAPAVMAAHSTEADEVDECLLPMAQSFVSNWFPSRLNVPDYDSWFRLQDETPSYQRYRDILKLIGFKDKRKWLLKNPSHLFGIDALMTAFPDACIIQTHRNPLDSMASLVSLLSGIRTHAVNEQVDRNRILARESSFWAEAARRGIAAQDREPNRFVNVQQAEIRSNPLAVVHKIYAHFDLVLSPEAESRMRTWTKANPPDARSTHAYDHVTNGSDLASEFAPYLERYCV